MARKRGPQSYVRSSFPRTVNRIMSMKPKSLFLGHRVFTRGSRRPGRVHPLRRASGNVVSTNGVTRPAVVTPPIREITKILRADFDDDDDKTSRKKPPRPKRGGGDGTTRERRPRSWHACCSEHFQSRSCAGRERETEEETWES
jgi:hypothetical protein